MHIDKNSPVPAYCQLKNLILEKINSGEYSAGSPIPSERELSETLNISRMTVRQALNQLTSEGILYRVQGKGTFVSNAKIEQRNIMSFSETVAKRGMIPSTKVLKFERIKPSDDIRNVLMLAENEFVYDLKRLRLANNIPVAIEESYIPERHCPNLERFDLQQSLYKILREEYHHNIAYADNLVEAAKASAESKKLLEIPGSVPVLRIYIQYYTDSGIKLYYEESVYRSDNYKYSIRIFSNNIE
ncbi:MAG TPA: GntR family transcriptional regulator [Clostridiaceae bacterium]|nr:GntR family transcriptional regulator [Clostridiaceae bacterium]